MTTRDPAPTAAFAAHAADQPLAPHTIRRRAAGPRDVEIEILFCGVCHTDIHMARNEWGMTQYPIVPGHEIIGRISRVGDEVSKFAPGATVGVGCLVDSCRTCPACREGLENYCEGEGGMILTYGSPDPKGPEAMTCGGYSTSITVDEDFVLSIPENLDPAGAAPLLCAGITTYSPLRNWNVSKGDRIGVVGLGGLGHMALKLANAMGARVTLFTTSPGKAEDARRLGAHDIVISKNAEEMEQQAGQLDFIINTVPTPHDLNPYLNCLRRDGTMCLVGAPDSPHPPVNAMGLIFKRRSVAGSLIGGLAETQEMLDFCGRHNITSEIEMIRMDQINEAYERMLRSDVRYRFVIDMASLRG